MISYGSLEKARLERAAKEAEKEAAKEAKKAERGARKAKKEVKKAAKEAEEVASATPEVEEATAGKRKLGRNKITQKRKSPEEVGTPEPKANVARMSEA